MRKWNWERPKSPIMEAIHADKEEMVTLLLKHGSKVNSISQNSYCRGNFHYIGQAPLHLAIREGNIGIAKILLKHGADINIYSDWLLTPLNFAINNNQVEMVQFLIDQNAKVNNDNEYNEPLKEAISNGYFPIAELLLKYGANPDKPDYHGNTLLNKATKKNKLEIVQMLVKYKANPNIPSSNFPGQTPLQNAISKGYIDIAKTLLEHEADMNIFNQEGDTALTLAIKKNDVEMIRLLLEHGVEVNVKISSGYINKPFTALNVASRGLFPNKEIIELLKENGAKEE